MKIRVLKGSEEFFALALEGAAADDVRKPATHALGVLLETVASCDPGQEVVLVVSRDKAEEMSRQRALLAGRARIGAAAATREERAAKDSASVMELRKTLAEAKRNEGSLLRQIGDLSTANKRLEARVAGVEIPEEESATGATGAGVPGM